MEIVGVIQYRLIGNHPAAQGRNATISFPGESIPLSEVLSKLVRENSVNENRYKLDVVRITSPPGSSVVTTEPVGKNTILKNYDRITVNISVLQLQDALATAEEAQQRDEERREREGELAVEAAAAMSSLVRTRRTEDAKGSSVSFGNASSSVLGGVLPAHGGHSASTRDLHELERATRVAAKRFPVAPGRQKSVKQERTENGLHEAKEEEADSEEVCALCDLAPFEPRTRPCCGAVVCTSCFESAALMTTQEGTCPVCGLMLTTSTSHASRTVDAFALHAMKHEQKEAKVFARGAGVPVTNTAATAHARTAFPSATAHLADVGPSARGDLDPLLSSRPPMDGLGAATSTSLRVSAERSWGSTVGASKHPMSRFPCGDGDLQAYEKTLQQHLPSIAHFLFDEEVSDPKRVKRPRQ